MEKRKSLIKKIMKIAMVTADIKTEPSKGIAIYTNELTEGLKKSGLDSRILTFK